MIIQSSNKKRISPANYSLHPFLLAKAIEIPGLRRRRKIWAFLPADYNVHTHRRYPVVYIQDAQNVFEGWKAPGGHSWEVHNTMRRLGFSGMEASIIIGIEHGGRRRIGEFSPLTQTGGFAPEGNAYADFLANKLKKMVDSKLRTLPERENTALIGSSMGGLISFYTGLKHQDVFSKIGALSSSFWAAPALYDLVKQVGMHYPMEFYLSVGQLEGRNTILRSEAMYQKLIQAGFPAQNLHFSIQPHGKHDELLWRHEFETCYRWWMQKK